MQRIAGRLVLSPTDLTVHVACTHATALDLAVAQGGRPAPPPARASLDLVFARGLDHERAYLESLRGQALTIAEIAIPEGDAGDADERRREAERLTVAAMRAGTDVVYQGVLYDGEWGGQADFLLRVDAPSGFGPWSYEVADTKLARRMKVPALLQMAVYADRLATLQGVAPQRLYVVTGDGEQRPWRLVDVAAYARRLRAKLRTFVEAVPPTEPVPVAHCAQCAWQDACVDQWVRADDLSLVAGMRRGHRAALRDAGIATVAGLAGRNEADLPRTIGRATRERLLRQAREQMRERETGHASYTLLPPSAGLGLLRLPAPDEGDLYLDFEGDPFADDGRGREYLAGLGRRDGSFTALWAHSPDDERAMTVELLKLLLDRWRIHPGMHVYHYAPYETTALKRLTARHGAGEAELDVLLRGERFVDLYGVVRQGLVISKESYSLKKLEAFYWGTERPHGTSDDGDAEVTGALDSVVAYERWLIERDDTLLRQIESYNADDVRSTRDLHDWLEERRSELEAAHEPQPRPRADSDEPAEALPEQPIGVDEQAEIELAQRCHDAGQPLLGHLVQWHRREARPAWWDFFRVETLEEDDIAEDRGALGPLSAPELVGTDRRSRLWRYTFPPQETNLRQGETAHDLRDHRSAGTVREIDAVAGYVVLKRQAEPLAPLGLHAPGPLPDTVLRQSVAACAQDVLAGRPTVAGALLDRRVPDGLADRDGRTPYETVLRVAGVLDGRVLAVQGPPGSGKTTLAAQLVRQLLDSGKRVGVTATSHAVIGNLLVAVGRPAVQKCSASQHCGSDVVEWTDDNAVVADGLESGEVTLAAGTAWMWARPEFAGSVDVLVIDEAGQFSLAYAVAVSRAARGVVLFGDPQQLPQPTQAVHPGGSGASVLEHLLDGHDTVPADRGVFLDRTYRMHPRIAGFVSDLAYEGRLAAAPDLDRQRVLGGGAVSGSGLRVVPVSTSGRSARSPEEADVVARIWRSLQGVPWEDAKGERHPLGPDDVLVVAPYNAQVAEIGARVPGARVGTVDRFQGREAPVVLFSMTSSSAADAPRGVDFLYDLHRLNVAISRARALAVAVLSPALLDAEVRTPEQLRRVNALCRLAEEAAEAVVVPVGNAGESRPAGGMARGGAAP